MTASDIQRSEVQVSDHPSSGSTLLSCSGSFPPSESLLFSSGSLKKRYSHPALLNGGEARMKRF